MQNDLNRRGSAVITDSTVLVLGAGASEPYGFPTGTRLAQIVCSRFAEICPPTPGLHTTEFFLELLSMFRSDEDLPQWKVRAFVPAFVESSCATLDEFVEAEGNREFLPLVKAAMICELIRCEQPDHLFPDMSNGGSSDWYGYLFRQMRAPKAEDFARNQVKVITFNLDRSFERRLFLMLRGAYGLSDEQAARQVACVPVLHVHGSLGGLQWLNDRRPESRDYGPTATIDQKRALLDQIHLVHDELRNRDLEPARQWIREAGRIAFIGFGYHRLLLDRLGLVGFRGKAAIWGSTKNLTEAERSRIQQRFGPDQPSIQLSYDMDALQFLRTSAVLATD